MMEKRNTKSTCTQPTNKSLRFVIQCHLNPRAACSVSSNSKPLRDAIERFTVGIHGGIIPRLHIMMPAEHASASIDWFEAFVKMKRVPL